MSPTREPLRHSARADTWREHRLDTLRGLARKPPRPMRDLAASRSHITARARRPQDMALAPRINWGAEVRRESDGRPIILPRGAYADDLRWTAALLEFGCVVWDYKFELNENPQRQILPLIQSSAEAWLAGFTPRVPRCACLFLAACAVRAFVGGVTGWGVPVGSSPLRRLLASGCWRRPRLRWWGRWLGPAVWLAAAGRVSL